MNIMISSVQNLSEPKNLEFVKRNNLNVISIRDVTPSSPQYQAMWDTIDSAGIKNLLVVSFDDLTEDLIGYSKPYMVPQKEHISTIIDWVRQKSVENPTGFIIQCTGGVSRSSAVAILANIIVNPSSEPLSVINPLLHSPNYKVLELGGQILGNQGIKEQTKQLIDETSEEWMARLLTDKDKKKT